MLFRLDNDHQANNCFINVVVQNIWHLNGFKFLLRDMVILAERIDREEADPIVFELVQLLKEVKESEEWTMHSVASLKKAILTEMFGAGNFAWNEQADACEAFELILRKVHEFFMGSAKECHCKLHDACQLTLSKRVTCLSCKEVNLSDDDSDVFSQLCYM